MEIISELKKAMTELDEEKISSLLRLGIDKRMDLIALVNDGLTSGLRQLGELFGQGQAFLPELIRGAQIFQQSIKTLEPHIKKEAVGKRPKFLIGTVSGDIHDVGKNIVFTVFLAAGYEVVDLGVDVPAEVFVQRVKEEKPDLVGLSALLTTTMFHQQKVIDALREAGLRDRLKVIIGGAPVSEAWAKKIGADAYAEDVFTGLKKANRLLSIE